MKSVSPPFILLCAGLVAVLLLELVSHSHGYFDATDIWGFNAWYGFGVTLVCCVVARVVHAFIRRDGDYYD